MSKLVTALGDLLERRTMMGGIITDPREIKSVLSSVRGYADGAALVIGDRQGVQLAVRLAAEAGKALKTMVDLEKIIRTLPDKEKWYDSHFEDED